MGILPQLYQEGTDVSDKSRISGEDAYMFQNQNTISYEDCVEQVWRTRHLCTVGSQAQPLRSLTHQKSIWKPETFSLDLLTEFEVLTICLRLSFHLSCRPEHKGTLICASVWLGHPAKLSKHGRSSLLILRNSLQVAHSHSGFLPCTARLGISSI